MVTSNPFYAFKVHFILKFITKHFKLIKSFGFFSKKICPCEPREIIYTYKNVSLSTQTFGLHGTHEVHVEKLKRLLGGEILTLLVHAFGLLSLWQGPQTPLAFFPSLGRPRTQLNFPRVRRSLKFMWPSLSCHNSICSSMDT